MPGLMKAIPTYKDNKIGRVGYEINFNRYFYIYQPPRPLDVIEKDIKAVEKEILEMIGGVEWLGK